MSQAQVPLIVLTRRQDDVELINRSLRDGGHAVHCHWVDKLDGLVRALESSEPEMIWFFRDNLDAQIRDIAKIRQQAAPSVPLVVVCNTAEESDIVDAMLSGAQDLVSSSQPDRLRYVAERELRAYRLERALNETLQSATQYKRQLKSFLEGSVDAIAYVQEGIVVEANQAWAELFGYPTADGALGPLMDHFDGNSQTALKGALVACAKGRWKGESLKAVARRADGATMPLDLSFETATFDGEPAVKLCVARRQTKAPEPEQLVEEAVHKDPMTGFYHRRRFLELLTDRLDSAVRGGVRALAYIRPDKFGAVEEQIGPIASEDVLVQMAAELRSLLQPTDLYGRFGGQVFTVFFERGSIRDIEAWANHACSRIAERMFAVAHHTLSVTCTIGLAEVGPGKDGVEALLAEAKRANQRGRELGGNRVILEETSDESTRIQRFDAIWVHQIKAALMENRFRLGHLPIASLAGDDKIMYDTVVRMIDAQGTEVAANDFMPAAARNRLMRSIDRWVIGATLAYCSKQQADCIFIKLSSESLIDRTLLDWLGKATASSGVSPGRLCFQVSEEIATQYLAQTKTLGTELRARGHRFAIEHFGVGRDSQRVLAGMPLDYVKIDGSLMESLATNAGLQERVRNLIAAAQQRKIPTIAERVENATTMAVLFQLGAAYVQGHYLREPDVVLEERA